VFCPDHSPAKAAATPVNATNVPTTLWTKASENVPAEAMKNSGNTTVRAPNRSTRAPPNGASSRDTTPIQPTNRPTVPALNPRAWVR
jgi:hypothetical protein